MLQIKVIILLSVFLSSVTTASVVDPEWLLKNAFESEQISLDDAQIVLPAEFQQALENYHAGNYRFAAVLLRKIRDMNLPDGQLDFVAFALAECYRQLRLQQRASEQYRFVSEWFPLSDKVPPSLFRLLEYAVNDGNMETVDSIFIILQDNYKEHPLFNHVLYVCGTLYFKNHNLEEALDLLSQISKRSSRYPYAQFVSGLCYLRKNDYKKALLSFEYVKNNSGDADLSTEAAILIGDVYFGQDNFPVALQYYQSVPKDSKRYQFSVVKTARAYLDFGKYEQARDLSRKFLSRNKDTEFFFEMASILEQAYTKLGNEDAAGNLSSLIYRQIVDSRLTFEVFEEIDRLADMAKSWQILEYEAIRKQKESLRLKAQKNTASVRNLEKKLRLLLFQIDPSKQGADGSKLAIPNQAERRYLNILKEKIRLYEDSILVERVAFESKSSLAQMSIQDTLLPKAVDSIARALKRLQTEHTKIEQEYSLVVKECFGDDFEGRNSEEQIQAKFVDWAFMKYQGKQEDIKKRAQEIAEYKRGEKPQVDSLKQKSKEVIRLFTELDRDKLKIGMVDDRVRLISHIKTMLEVYPSNRFNPQILFRLAELLYDAAGDEFQAKLMDFERKMAEGKDNAGLVFPDYKLEEVISVYDQIIHQYPRSDLADNAYYYKALALQKQGVEEKANLTFMELVEKYPDSEYYVEANMNIGRYYFDHPKINDGQGYDLAQNAFRKVLYYRDHPQFIQALYHLGWCYYMQDKYDEAIAVFKYLIEEADLDFDPKRMEEEQVVNPLLRGEAIDYIAISFDEESKIDEAINFLQLVGNVDYSSMVLRRIGELREEDLDFGTAISVYKKLLLEYPLSITAPEVTVKLIKLYDGLQKPDSANLMRENFFKLFCRGSKWQTEILKKDSALVFGVDSMAISIGMYVADAAYRAAEVNKDRKNYSLAADKYGKIIDKYQHHLRAADAHWNLAVILDTKLDDKPLAYNLYIKYSNLIELDSARREQASLNAVAIAQSLLPPDSLVQKGTVGFSATKVIEAVNNYINLFPEGNSVCKVLLNMGAVYFNRQMFSRAAEIYEKVINRGPENVEYFEAMLLLAQCHFGEEKWQMAISIFEKVWKETKNTAQRSSAYKLLLQSEFLNAKGLFAAGDFANAAIKFRDIEKKYPQSDYGDIVLFNAAEAFEKQQKWARACNSYYDLIKNYPQSKLAPDALFNAAGDFEKADKFNDAAQAYETIVNKYPESEKAKDALFNLGFCYEKLGKIEKMAEAHERYSSLYPGEKDVETMLLRSASYYAKAGMYDKAVTVYKSFIRRFNKSPKTVEALFMIAKCNYDNKDINNALLGFAQAEQQNIRFAQEGLETNDFYASEAAFYLADINREKFLDVKLKLPEDQLKNSLKEKSDLLADAAKAYQRVIQYQSERMFEAAFRVGELYENLSDSWRDQQRPKLDPIKEAVLEKEILTLSSQLLQKTFLPYKKALEISTGFDSLSSEQMQWVNMSKKNLSQNFLNAGNYLLDAVYKMQNTPVPKQIRSKPLHYYQYLKQLFETLAPMKMQVIQYFLAVRPQVDSLQLKDSTALECKNQIVYNSYQIGNDYDSLSVQILKNTQDLPKGLSADERDELLFQLEDIIYELQDKAIFTYEESLERIKTAGLSNNKWFRKIIENLARLSPDKYGATFYFAERFESGPGWLVRGDSIKKWNSLETHVDGWREATQVGKLDVKGFSASPQFIWGGKNEKKVYLWKHIFLNGIPRDASVYICSKGNYRLFVNGALVMSDSLNEDHLERVDSATGISSLLNGGDNVIAAEVVSADTMQKGAAIVFTALIDTTQQFSSSSKLPAAAIALQKQNNRIDSKQKNKTGEDKTGKPLEKTDVHGKTLPAYAYQYRNRGELLKAIEDYRDREKIMNADIRKERLEIQKLRLKKEELDAAIQRVKEQIAAEKESVESMSREK